jgi:hypothetical protein
MPEMPILDLPLLLIDTPEDKDVDTYEEMMDQLPAFLSQPVDLFTD